MKILMLRMYDKCENLHDMVVHIKIKAFYDIKQFSLADRNPLPPSLIFLCYVASDDDHTPEHQYLKTHFR
jgi:hypothetical protein